MLIVYSKNSFWAAPWQNQQNDWRPAKTQISLGIRPVWSKLSLFTQWVAKALSFLHADSEDWSDWICHEAAVFSCAVDHVLPGVL